MHKKRNPSLCKETKNSAVPLSFRIKKKNGWYSEILCAEKVCTKKGILRSAKRRKIPRFHSHSGLKTLPSKRVTCAVRPLLNPPLGASQDLLPDALSAMEHWDCSQPAALPLWRFQNLHTLSVQSISVYDLKRPIIILCGGCAPRSCHCIQNREFFVFCQAPESYRVPVYGGTPSLALPKSAYSFRSKHFCI